MIDLKRLKQLIRLMRRHDLTELDVRDGQEQVTLKRGSSGHVVPLISHLAPAPASSLPAPPAAAAASPDAAETGLIPIKSPMVGTFYPSPSPDAEVFVRAGTRIEPGKVLCIIEAMKVFNELKSEVSGTISKIMVSNGQAVEFGQSLFLVTPD